MAAATKHRDRRLKDTVALPESRSTPSPSTAGASRCPFWLPAMVPCTCTCNAHGMHMLPCICCHAHAAIRHVSGLSFLCMHYIAKPDMLHDPILAM
eukprot:scaffold18076_cov33-Phaeocystis_antarctica.AAC.2